MNSGFSIIQSLAYPMPTTSAPGSGRPYWLWASGAVLVLHAFLTMLFLSEMHSEMPLNRWRHSGASASFLLVSFWYLSPIPSLLVSAFAFNGSRLAGRQGAEYARLGSISWILIGFTCAAATVQAIQARIRIDLAPSSDQDTEQIEDRGWIISQLYTTSAIVLVLVQDRLLDRRRRKLINNRKTMMNSKASSDSDLSSV